MQPARRMLDGMNLVTQAVHADFRVSGAVPHGGVRFRGPRCQKRIFKLRSPALSHHWSGDA